MIEPQAMQDRGLQVMHMERILADVEAEVVGLAQRLSRLDAPPGHPHRIGLGMMVAAFAAAQCHRRFNHRRPAKFAPPDDQRFIKQAPAFEVHHQGR